MPFLLRPFPLAGESLSSWRQRSGRANGFLWFPTEKTPKLGDPDLEPSPTELQWLSDEFILPKTRLSSLCLNQFVLWSVGEVVGSQFVRWVLTHKGASDGKAASGYCPVCLQADDIPYFRLVWRIAFVTHCPIHHCRLLTACPNCGHNCWPAPYASRHRHVQRWTDMRHCQVCGHDLSDALLAFDGSRQLSKNLFDLISANTNGAIDCQFPREDYFRALWSTCRLISRKIDYFAAAGRLEGLDQVRHSHRKGWIIEIQTADVRQAIVANAAWMLEEWPERFVATCGKACLSRADFGGADKCSPQWFDEVVKHRLVKRVTWITREDVATAVTQLEAEDRRVSKNALRRQLGITESRAINEILDQRREATANEMGMLCLYYRELLEHTPPSRDQQRTLCRDFLILLATSLSFKTVEIVCRMSKDEMGELRHRVSRIRSEEGDLGKVLVTFSELFDQYDHGIRPVFLSRFPEDVEYWFLSRFGKKMDGHSVRERFARILKHLFEPKLWNSMDVFLHTLSSHLDWS